MYKVEKQGLAGKKTPGPQRIELLLHIHHKSVGGLPGARHMALGLEKPQNKPDMVPALAELTV